MRSFQSGRSFVKSSVRPFAGKEERKEGKKEGG